MSNNLLAITLTEPVYPGFVSINREDDGSVTIVVREAPRHHIGARMCGHSCFPGQAGCNNWCGYDPTRQNAANPEEIDRISCGDMAKLTVSAEQWDAAVAGLLAG